LGGLRSPDFKGTQPQNWVKTVPKRGVSEKTLDVIGASEGIRTLDIHVGNVTLYQTELRSLPNRPANYDISIQLQASFHFTGGVIS